MDTQHIRNRIPLHRGFKLLFILAGYVIINLSGMEETPESVPILPGPGRLVNHNPFMTGSWFES